MTNDLSDIEQRLRDAFDASEPITQPWVEDVEDAGRRTNIPHAAHSRSRTQRWVLPAIAAAAVVAVAASLVVFTQPTDQQQPPTASGTKPLTNNHRTNATETTRMIDGVTWTLSITGSTTGARCVSISASHGSNSGSLGGGCGETTAALSRVGEGALRFDGTSYNVAYGLVADTVSSVCVTLRNGMSLSSQVTDGGWFVVTKTASAFDPNHDFTVARALNDQGAAIAHRRLAALSAYRRTRNGSPAGTR